MGSDIGLGYRAEAHPRDKPATEGTAAAIGAAETHLCPQGLKTTTPNLHAQG